MTLLLREVAALVAGAALWLALATMIAALPAFAHALLRRRRPTGHELRAALVGGLLMAGAFARFGIDDPVGVVVWHRPLPLIWVLAGAVAGTLLAAMRPSRVAVTDRAAG
ncbi:MAG: hypothetical protein A2135_00825 [Actinobacteria bacterium RBG_16_67_15]|nr:MAG: hypothetical protein A2135_00825 [Actinobacteria bacterium RBG_16_67_15]